MWNRREMTSSIPSPLAGESTGARENGKYFLGRSQGIKRRGCWHPNGARGSDGDHDPRDVTEVTNREPRLPRCCLAKASQGSIQLRVPRASPVSISGQFKDARAEPNGLDTSPLAGG